MIDRRKLLVALGAGAVAFPLRSFRQKPHKVWRVGMPALRNRPANLQTDVFGAFHRGMRELGYVEGKNYALEARWAEGNYERIPQLPAELVALQVDVIVVAGAQDISAAQKATRTIPIITATAPDPVGSGFVKSLAHPGGNIKGLSNVGVDISAKQLEMLLSIVPGVTRIAMLLNPANSSHASALENVQAAGRQTGIRIIPVHAGTGRDIELAFPTMVREKAGALLVARDGFFIQQVNQLAGLALKHRLPSISGYRSYAQAGGLMSYGQNPDESFRRAAVFVDRILKGAKPGDLPIEQPTTFELFINRRAAKALGLAIPQSLSISADKVIE
jgi:putative ABC transport system substrate-binding protein